MNNIKININMENAAFEGNNKEYELNRILKELADKIRNYETPTKLKDINGNTVGIVEYNN